MKRFRWIAFLAPVFLLGTVDAQEAAATGESGEVEEKDWLEFYYQDPDPGRLVSEVKQWAKDGTLKNQGARPVIIAFLSQVFRQNRKEIAGWYEELSGLPDEYRQIIHTAMLFSRTTEADALLRESFGNEYEEQKHALPKILEMKLAQRNTLDMLWGFFYATGSENAIRRIVWSFRFDAAPDNPDFAKIPKDHRPLYKDLPDAAAWSLVSNARRHPKVRKVCEDLYDKDKDLVAPEKRRLGDVLHELTSKKPPPEAQP